MVYALHKNGCQLAIYWKVMQMLRRYYNFEQNKTGYAIIILIYVCV